MPADSILLAAFVVPLGAIALDFACAAMLLHHLQTYHSKVWEDLGRPEIPGSNIATSRFRLWRFIWTGEFFELRSGSVSALCVGGIAAQLMLVICFAYLAWGARA
jgi:hypothetical protein